MKRMQYEDIVFLASILRKLSNYERAYIERLLWW